MNVEPFSLSLAAPLETAAGTIDRREGFVVQLAVDGVEGVGEATPLPGWTESVDACREALNRVVNRDAEATRGALDPNATPAAAHGVELSLLDARARAAEVPLHRVLTDDPATATPALIPVNAAVGDGTPEATADAAGDAVDAGYGAVKVKVGARSMDEDADRVEAVRDAVGTGVELRADANGAWTREEAEAALECFADWDVAYVEQPLQADDLAGLAELRGGPVDVALDESLGVHAVPDVAAAGAADVLILKPMVLGGPVQAAVAAARARQAGITPVVTTTVDAVYARTAAIHVAATLPDPRACGLATAGRMSEDLAPDPAPVDDGGVRVPDGPGNLGDPA